MKTKQAQEYNNFKTKYPSHMEAAKAGTEEKEDGKSEETEKQTEQKVENAQVLNDNKQQILIQEFIIQMMSQMT